MIKSIPHYNVDGLLTIQTQKIMMTENIMYQSVVNILFTIVII